MSDPVIGVVTRTVDYEARPALMADMSTVIIYGPMPNADDKAFPINRVVKGYTNDTSFTRKMGVGGFVPDAIRGLNDQLGEAQFAAQVIILRTPHSSLTDPALKLKEEVKGIIGDSTLGTGLWAGLLAPEDLQAVPRLHLVPGYTGQLANSVGEVEATTEGAGYVPGQAYVLTFSGGGTGAVQAKATVTANEDGTLAEPVFTDYGAYYTAAPTVAIDAPPGGGTQAVYTATFDRLANPVIAALGGILPQFLSHAAVESPGISQQSDEQWRETINDQRIIPLSGGVKVVDPVSGNTVVRPLAPRFIGALVRRDHETGSPFFSACNQPIKGIIGPARRIRFNISQGENEGQALLRANIGILVAGDVGNDFAIAAGGYTILATDNAGEDELWRFYNQRRGRDYIHIMMTRTLRYYLGKFNLTAQTVQAIVGTMKNILRDEQAREHIIGYKVTFSGNKNSAEQIRLGNLTVQFAAEEPAPLRKITNESSRYRPAIDAMIGQLEAQLNLAA